MRHSLPLFCSLLLLSACGDKEVTDDTGSGDDTASGDDTSVEALSCDDPVDPYPMSDGQWRTTIDGTVFNNCENSAGKGLHIHVGEDTYMDVVTDGSCLDIQAEEMPMQGVTDGQQFVVDGLFVMEIGTCSVGISATMTATMVSEGQFSYRMDAVADVHSEVVDGACDLIIGETENHTFPALPCDQAWEGEGFFEAR